jgi:hypothetical protein
MIDSNHLTSLLVKDQLPEHVRDNPDYNNFTLFLESYYQWLEQNGKVTERTKNLLEYRDIDKTTDEFMDYFVNEFLPYFPKDSLVSKQEALKVAKQLYQTKGTPASYQFLFRTLYNSDFDVFYTKDSVLKPSSGIWYVPKSLKLATSDVRFLNIANYRLLGETTRSIATVETSIKAGLKIEVFISNIERLFHSGEYVTVVDNNNQPLIVDGTTLSAKIVGQLSQININPDNRGLLYQTGDPVIVYGGLNASNGHAAIAEVGTTTKGEIQRINVVKGGFGYSLPQSFQNSNADPFTDLTITSGEGALASVASIDTSAANIANVTFLTTDVISRKINVRLDASNYNFANTNAHSVIANANTTLVNALSFLAFSTFPISSVRVDDGGGGISQIPVVTADTKYDTEVPDIYSKLSDIGILSPIQITNTGTGYTANDRIIIRGGTGYGAYANITSVGANGEISQVKYVANTTNRQLFPIGGMGYKSNTGVTVSVISTNPSAANASLYVPGILGQGATFSVVVSRAGSISTINLTDPGEDYVENANVSLRIQDIVVSNVNIAFLPNKLDTIFQGANVNAATYYATVESISLIQPNGDPTQSLYNLRVFNYNTNPETNLKLKYYSSNTLMQLIMTNATPAGYEARYNNPGNGLKNYGDGSAKATASFLDGLVIGQGQYLNKSGQPSSHNVLQSQDYNNYTYIISVEKELSKYKQVLLDLLHPAGLKLIGKNRTKSNVEFRTTAVEGLFSGAPLNQYTGYSGTTANMISTFASASNNIVSIENVGNIPLYDIIKPDYILEIKQPGGPFIRSKVVSVDYLNRVFLQDSFWLSYANVAYATGNTGSRLINITALTNSYDIINNGVYSNTAYPLKDIIKSGDWVLIANNAQRVIESVNYANNTIVLSNNLSSNASNGFISVRKVIDTTEINLYGYTGIQYVPELIIERLPYSTITTEDDKIIILG